MRLRNDKPPFNDVSVRRALMIGTDRKGITETVMGRPWVHFSPLEAGQEGHVPLADLPASALELFTYDVAKAQQMLADAGYADGFKAHVILGTRELCSDLVERVASDWERDFGIELTLEVVDTPIVGSTAAATPDEWDIFVEWHITLPPYTTFRNYYHSSKIPPLATTNLSFYQDPYVDEQLEKAEKMIDEAERILIMEELFVMVTNDAPIMPFPFRGVYSSWWPWVKNYYGENYQWGADPPYELIWIDQDLKAEMGY